MAEMNRVAEYNLRHVQMECNGNQWNTSGSIVTNVDTSFGSEMDGGKVRSKAANLKIDQKYYYKKTVNGCAKSSLFFNCMRKKV